MSLFRVGALVAFVLGCAKPVALERRACPCGTGWRCCAAENVCVREEERCVPPFDPNAALIDLGAGEALDLGPFRCESAEGEPRDACLGVLHDSSLVYDRRAHLMYLTGGGYQLGMSDGLRVFDPRTLAWRDAYPSTPCALMTRDNFDADAGAWRQGPVGPYPRPVAAETYDEVVMLDARREYVLFHRTVSTVGTCASPQVGGQGTVAVYEVDAGTWRFTSTPSDVLPESSSSFVAAEFDPPSGRVFLLADEGLWAWEPSTGVKERVLGRFPFAVGYGNALVYFPPNQRHYYFDRISKRVLELRPERDALFRSEVTIVLENDGGFPASRMPGFAYDEKHQVLVGGVVAGQARVFDPTTMTFSNLTLRPRSAGQPVGSLASQLIVYDPVNEVFIFVADEGLEARVWAFRYRR